MRPVAPRCLARRAAYDDGVVALREAWARSVSDEPRMNARSRTPKIIPTPSTIPAVTKSGTAGVGICRSGQRSCVSAQMTGCVGQILPRSEVCNGIDDDCDGQIDEGFADTEDLDGLFAGWDPERGAYDTRPWQYAGMAVRSATGSREASAARVEAGGTGGAGRLQHGQPPEVDDSLQHPRCVFQLLRKHYQRYTPEVVEEICGIEQDLFLEVAETLCENSGRERTGAFCYAVGWTQHSTGVQIIRAAAISSRRSIPRWSGTGGCYRWRRATAASMRRWPIRICSIATARAGSRC